MKPLQINCGLTRQIISECKAHGFEISLLDKDQDISGASDLIDISKSETHVKLRVVAMSSGPYRVTHFKGNVEDTFIILDEPGCSDFCTAAEYVEKIILPEFAIS
ncbi:hypothetical protein [Pseudomonas abietaniphila]|nr:hypothetical protein [Pseudomonas abietaniphila]